MRSLRVSCASFGKTGDNEEQRHRALDFVDRAAVERPDLVILPENCFNDAESAEPVPGAVVQEFAERCRRYGMHLVLPMIQRKASGEKHNSALLIDDSGNIVGEYLKMFPTDVEMRDGIVPGREPKVFETRLGKIGIAICFDLNFPEVMAGMAAQAVDIVCFPSAFQGGRLLARWALDHGAYIASAHRGGIGVFVDKTGQVLEYGDPQHQPIITRTLNLDRQVFHLDHNHLKLPAIRKRFGREVAIEVWRPEALFVLESLRAGLSVEQIVRDYELEPLADYLERSRSMRREILAQAAAT